TSVDQHAHPQSVAAGVEVIGLLVRIHLVHHLRWVDLLVARCARLAAAEASPRLRRALAREFVSIESASDLFGERDVVRLHPSSSEQCSLTRDAEDPKVSRPT